MREGITLVWFTGIISQFNTGYCDIPNLKINHNFLNKILNNYKSNSCFAIINVRNDIEKEQYLNLIVKDKLENKLMFVFCNINSSYIDIIDNIKYRYDISYYIDCSRKRLININSLGLLESNKLIHISQLFD